MAAEYFFNIGFRFVSVPYAFWVDDHSRPMFTDVQATSMVYPDAPDSHRHPQSTHVVAQTPASLTGATAAPMGRRTLVGAAENMHLIEKGHYSAADASKLEAVLDPCSKMLFSTLIVDTTPSCTTIE
jgi:hypothetical protein